MFRYSSPSKALVRVRICHIHVGVHAGVHTYTKAWLHIKSVMAESDYLRKDRVELCQQVRTDQSSKVCTYLAHNPTLEIGTVYTGCVVPEFKRIVYIHAFDYLRTI